MLVPAGHPLGGCAACTLWLGLQGLHRVAQENVRPLAQVRFSTLHPCGAASHRMAAGPAALLGLKGGGLAGTQLRRKRMCGAANARESLGEGAAT